MKIALIRQRYVAHGGAERYLDALTLELSRRGHEVRVFANRWDAPSEEMKGVTFHRVAMLGWFSFTRALSFAFFAEREVRRAGCELIFSLERTVRQDVYRAGDGCHREWLAQRRRYLSPWKRAALRLNPLHAAMLWLERRTFSAKRTGAVIANSQRGKDEIVRHYGFPAERIHVVYNGVDCARFAVGKREGRGEDFVLLFAGSGFERKGLEFCIRALALLPKNVQLKIAGKGNRARYEALARQLGVGERVEFLGAVKDVETLYASADLLVLPAIYEPFANVCLEAMAAGLPVVTTRVNGASEVIVHGQNGAVLEDPRDARALAELITPFLDRQILAQTSRRARRTAEKFSFSENVEKTLQVLLSVRK